MSGVQREAAAIRFASAKKGEHEEILTAQANAYLIQVAEQISLNSQWLRAAWCAILDDTMRLTHINVTIPKGGEDMARCFYGMLLGLHEIPKPQPLRSRGGGWVDASGADFPS